MIRRVPAPPQANPIGFARSCPFSLSPGPSFLSWKSGRIAIPIRRHAHTFQKLVRAGLRVSFPSPRALVCGIQFSIQTIIHIHPIVDQVILAGKAANTIAFLIWLEFGFGDLSGIRNGSSIEFRVVLVGLIVTKVCNVILCITFLSISVSRDSVDDESKGRCQCYY